MIFIFFVPGMFGSTLEAMLSSFTHELKNENVSLDIANDGSMHLYRKQFHPQAKNRLLAAADQLCNICTPIYPMRDAKLQDLAQNMTVDDRDHIILIYADSIKSAELNMLFQYHKIASGLLDQSIEVFFDSKEDYSNWGKNYKTWKDMQDWELREWLSISYPEGIQEWITSTEVKFKKDALVIANIDLLNNLEDTFIKLCRNLNLTLTSESDIHSFCEEWSRKQQYILDEYKLIESIVLHTVNNIQFEWNKLNLVAESIIQQHLRLAGYQIRCYNLNKFPTNSLELNTLLEKI
jgi:hypothetical protein